MEKIILLADRSIFIEKNDNTGLDIIAEINNRFNGEYPMEHIIFFSSKGNKGDLYRIFAMKGIGIYSFYDDFNRHYSLADYAIFQNLAVGDTLEVEFDISRDRTFSIDFLVDDKLKNVYDFYSLRKWLINHKIM